MFYIFDMIVCGLQLIENGRQKIPLCSGATSRIRVAQHNSNTDNRSLPSELLIISVVLLYIFARTKYTVQACYHQKVSCALQTRSL